jgi:hypothetical protein
LAEEDWDSIYRQVFSDSDQTPALYRGDILLQGGENAAYVAARFFDEEVDWKDASGRTIPHEMLFVVSREVAAIVGGANWFRDVMAQVRDAYASVFSLDPSTVPTWLNLPQSVFVSVDGVLSTSRIPLRGVDISKPLHAKKSAAFDVGFWGRFLKRLLSFVR